MLITIVKDDHLSDQFAGALGIGPNSTLATQYILSDFITSHGLQYDHISGRFTATKEVPHHGSTLLINRVVEISRETCEHLADQSWVPTRGQVSQAYQRIIRRYAEPGNVKALYSTLGTLVPLFAQWRMVEHEIPTVRVPTYKYGYGPEIIDTTEIVSPIHTTPFHLYDWRVNAPMEGVPNDTFVIERPAGLPLVSFFCGDYVGMQWVDASTPVSNDLATAVRAATDLARHLFTGFTGEILWFVEGSVITFASFSYAITASSRSAEYTDLAFSALRDYERSLETIAA